MLTEIGHAGLVLTRKVSERVIIRTPDGFEIKVMPVSIRDKRVLLGFDAPIQVTVYREEIQREIDEELASIQAGP